jgi:predicted O-methyltransferase YrrM
MTVQLTSEQDQNTVQCLIRLMASIQAEIYLEIGCAQLGTFDQFRRALPEHGLALGIDVQRYANWAAYKSLVRGGANFILLDTGSSNPDTVEAVKGILEERKVDFLFIDGDHGVEAVRLDWEFYSQLVRPGGVVVFHDVDFSAVQRGHLQNQGAAVQLLKLKASGKDYYVVPGYIGTAYVVV